MLKAAVLILLLQQVITIKDADACSAFLIKNATNTLMCKSYDWEFGEGIIIINPRGEKRISMPVIGGKAHIKWVSEYASITFNQYGQNLPNGGINERGLAIEVLVLNSSEYGAAEGYKCINELQWIQYGLDNFATVDQLINGTEQIKVKPLYAKVHYFVSDTSGKSAVIEYIDGKRVVSTGDRMPYKAITNSTYSSSVKGAKYVKGGCTRFNTITTQLNGNYLGHSNKLMIEKGFATLDKVKSKKRTQWQIVYDLRTKKIYFKTRYNRKIREVSISDFNTDRGAGIVYANLKLDCKKREFKAITKEINRYLLANAFNKLKLSLPDSALDELVNYTTTSKPTPKLQRVVDMFGDIQ